MSKSITILCLSIILGLFSCGTPGPTFRDKLKILTLQGESISKDQYENKVLILNLWATWCGPCIREMPDLQEMQAELSDDFVLLLASDEEPEKITKFVENNSFKLEFVRLNNSIESLGAYSLPTTFIVGKDGELVETLVGARKWNTPEQLKNIKKYLK